MELSHAKNNTQKGKSAQDYVDVDEIRDGVIVMKNRSLRAVLLVSSINFDLKSSEEQEAIIAQYQVFLNSLDFPLQIIVSSRKLNISPYLEMLKKKEKEHQNELMRMQVAEYVDFIGKLTDMSQIMSKFFYIVVPFFPIENQEGGFFSKVFAMANPKQKITEDKKNFEIYKNQLMQRVDQIEAGLGGVGVKIAPLGTEEIIELLYNSYNPTVSTNSIIKDVDKMELF